MQISEDTGCAERLLIAVERVCVKASIRCATGQQRDGHRAAFTGNSFGLASRRPVVGFWCRNVSEQMLPTAAVACFSGRIDAGLARPELATSPVPIA
jgi:hypothetical protein